MNRSRVSDAAECPPVAVINHGPGFADSLQTPPHAAVLSHAMTARLLAGSPTQLLSYTRESSPKKRPENLRIRALALVTSSEGIPCRAPTTIRIEKIVAE
jgi:hypothetical protein